MDFNKFKYGEKYINKIKINNKYLQSNNNQINVNNTNSKSKNTTNIYNYLIDCIIFTNDIDCLLNNQDKTFIDKKKLEIATQIDEKQNEYYDSFNYNKHFKKKLIQINLQKINNLSSCLYLCDYYKINIVIFDKNKDIYIKLNNKYKNNQIYKFDNGWSKQDNTIDYIEKSIYDIDINEYLIDDLNKKYNIYNTGLKAISNYKLADLQMIANNNNIDINVNGKHKLKKQLYEDLSKLSILNLP